MDTQQTIFFGLITCFVENETIILWILTVQNKHEGYGTFKEGINGKSQYCMKNLPVFHGIQKLKLHWPGLMNWRKSSFFVATSKSPDACRNILRNLTSPGTYKPDSV